SARRREVAPLEIENLVAVNHAVPLRTAAIPVPESRVREAVRSPPSQLVQDFAGRPRHSGTESTQGISTSRHKDHIGQADSDVPWNTPRVRALLDRAKADQGEAVAVRAKGERYEGILMPHTSFSGEDVLTVKLPNGYNIGIAVGDIE